MEYILSERNLKILESFCLVNCLFAFDYDGTLAPISTDRGGAVMEDKTGLLIRELNEMTTVAILTGRSVADVKRLLPMEPRFVIGNHGCEGMQSENELKNFRHQCELWMSGLHGVSAVFEKLGIVMENKEYSLSFHYRNSTNPEVAEGTLELILKRLMNANIVKGKMVVNVVPVQAMNKGRALELIMNQNKYLFGVYIGDDYTDEEVFKYKNPRLLTIKVGKENSLAKYYLENQEEMATLLHHLLGFLKKHSFK